MLNAQRSDDGTTIVLKATHLQTLVNAERTSITMTVEGAEGDLGWGDGRVRVHFDAGRVLKGAFERWGLQCGSGGFVRVW